MRQLSSTTGSLLLVLLITILSLTLPARSEAASFIVNSSSDTDDGSCSVAHCSLREAINAANANPGIDTISFNFGGTITLATTLPQITDTAGLTISAQPRRLTISGNQAVQILSVASGAPLTLQGLALVQGYATGNGGAINNSGPLTVDQCSFSDNQAAFGGAIYSFSWGAQWSVTRSTFYRNTATGLGGAIYNGTAIATIINSTFTGNTAPNGAVLVNGSGWSSDIYYSTIAGNSSSGGGSIFNSSGLLTLYGTIVANDTAGTNCAGVIQNGGGNLDSASSCGWGTGKGSLSNTNPLLRSLADNGGSTNTLALNPSSPAIDAGDVTSCPATDQRGITRPFGSVCDIGAVEYAGETWPLPFINFLLDK